MRGSAALDSNLLLLFVVGSASRAYIESHKGLSAYTTGSFNLLLKLLGNLKSVVLTPNTVTETSNLLDRLKRTNERLRVEMALRATLARFGETYVPSMQACELPECTSLGVADSVMLLLAARDATLITVDLDLFSAVRRRGYRAENFNHYRSEFRDDDA